MMQRPQQAAYTLQQLGANIILTKPLPSVILTNPV